MATTTLNINKNDIYYVFIKGNVYMCRFKAVIVDLHGLTERNLEFDDNLLETGKVIVKGSGKEYPYRLKNTKMVLFSQEQDRRFASAGIDYIALEIAGGIGECSWQYYRHNDTFNPYKIYRSFEDCVNEQNPVFYKGYNGKPALKEVYKVSLIEVLPENIFYENIGCDIYGSLLWSPRTYHWNGINAVIERFKVQQKHLGYRSTYSNMMFNLLEESFLFDDGSLENSYATAEECKAHNHVNVITF